MDQSCGMHGEVPQGSSNSALDDSFVTFVSVFDPTKGQCAARAAIAEHPGRQESEDVIKTH